MATRFITHDDFTGWYAIDEDYYNSTIVEDVEKNVLTDLLGVNYYNDFIDDLDGNNDPQTAIWTKFKDGEEYTNGYLIKYSGIIEMLVAFAYYEILKSKEFSVGTGFINPNNENSRVKSKTELLAIANERYNKGVNLYVQAEQWILYNSESFPNWKHKTKSYKQLISY